jgi:CRP-like cAMP-binding protein
VALATLGEGDCFGEMSLLTGAPRSATVVAQGAVEVFVLDRKALAPVLHDDPSLAETLSRVLAGRVAATVALFEGRRDELKRQAPAEPHGLLQKIRDFFRLD